MRRLLIAAPLLLLALLSAPQPTATAADTFGLTPEKKLAKVLEKCADTCFDCGDKAKELGLYTYARSFFDHALRYDPDHRDTRKVMGFKKKGKAWVLDEDMIPLADKINEAKRQELEAKLSASTEPIRRKAADELWKLVIDKELSAQQRMLALYHTVRLYPESRDAQKAVRSSSAYMWYKHQLDDESDTLRQKWISGATEGKVIEGRTEYETGIGFAMEKRRGDWVVVHTLLVSEVGPEWTRVLTQFAEAARKRSLETLGLPDPKMPETDEQRLHYTVFKQRDHFAKFIEACSNINDAAQRAEYAKVGYGAEVYRPYGAVFLYERLENDWSLRDAIAHDLGAKAVVRNTGWNCYWLVRGSGYLNSTQMNGSAATTMYAVKTSAVIDSGGRESLPGLGKCAAGWRLEVAMEVAAGSEMTLDALTKHRAPDYSTREMAHAFAMTEFLTLKYKEALKDFLDSARTELALRSKEKRQPESSEELTERLLKTLGKSGDELQAEFRAFVTENYVQLPAVG